MSALMGSTGMGVLCDGASLMIAKGLGCGVGWSFGAMRAKNGRKQILRVAKDDNLKRKARTEQKQIPWEGREVCEGRGKPSCSGREKKVRGSGEV